MADDPTIYLNGELLPRSRGSLRVDERGFLFGDGVYEVFRAVGGRVFRGEAHLRRLSEGLTALRIPRPKGSGGTRLVELAEKLLARNGLDGGEATVYLQVTRGAAERTHHFPPEGTEPTILMSSAPFTPPERMQREGGACILHPDQRWARAHLKTVNLLPNVMAKQAARDAGAVEAVFVRDGMLLEGSSSNLFAVVDGELRTYPAANYILRGITRDVVLGLARDRDMPVREEGLAVEELRRVEELFLTGTTTDVLPVVSLDGRTVGAGRPGPVTRTLQDAFLEELHRSRVGQST